MKHKRPHNLDKKNCDFCTDLRADIIHIVVVLSTKNLGEITLKKGPYNICFKHKEDIEKNISEGLNLLDAAKSAAHKQAAEKIPQAAEKVSQNKTPLENTYDEIIKGEIK